MKLLSAAPANGLPSFPIALLRQVLSAIGEGSRRGEWGAKLDPYRTATILMGSITHMIITWLLYRRPENLSKATKPMVAQLLKLVEPAEPSTTTPRKRKASPRAGSNQKLPARL
jgi:hypothetical protein